MGLRREFGLEFKDAEELYAPNTFKLLRENKCLTDEDIKPLESLYYQAMEQRWSLHQKHQAEHDELSVDQAQDLLKQANKIREFGDLRRLINAWKQVNQLLEQGNIQQCVCALESFNRELKQNPIQIEPFKKDLGGNNLFSDDKNIQSLSLISLMTHKMSTIYELKHTNHLNINTLKQVLRRNRENLAKLLAYEYSVLFATSDNQKFQGLKGDALKTTILKDFRTELLKASDLQQLQQIVSDLKQSPEYKILATGQDRVTCLFNLRTSSVVTFEKMVKEIEKAIEFADSRNLFKNKKL